MRLLRDEDLQGLVATMVPPREQERALAERWEVEATKAARDGDLKSFIQPSSLDLHVAEIYVPGRRAKESGGWKNPMTGSRQHSLGPGETALVTTEYVVLPDNMCAISFPPARVSARGVLMTNPGHVDPGYEGCLHLTLINMGAGTYTLEPGNAILTMLVFKLDQAVGKDFPARKGAQSGREGGKDGVRSNLDRLSPDFMDFKKQARWTVTKRIAKTTVVATIFASIVAAALSFGLGEVMRWRAGVTALERRVRELERDLEIKPRLERVERELGIP